MAIYLTMLLICCFGGFLANKVEEKNQRSLFIFFLMFLPLFLVSGFRYMVGEDYLKTYVTTFNEIANGVTAVRIDFGFYLINRIVCFFSNNYQWIFIITSFVINFFVVKSIIEQSENKFMSLFIYICGTLFFFSLNGVRQTMALVLFYYSLKYIETNDLKKYMLCNFIGVLFHNSALIFLPLYFFIGKRYKCKFKLLILIVISLLLPFIIPTLSSLLLNTKYAMYLTNGAYNPLETINVSTIINILLFTLYEVFYKNNSDDRRYNVYSNIHYIGIIVSLFMTKIPLILRIFMYFRYIEFLSVPYLISKANLGKRKELIANVIIIIIYFIYFIHGVYIANGNNVLPYQSVFFK